MLKVSGSVDGIDGKGVWRNAVSGRQHAVPDPI